MSALRFCLTKPGVIKQSSARPVFTNPTYQGLKALKYPHQRSILTNSRPTERKSVKVNAFFRAPPPPAPVIPELAPWIFGISTAYAAAVTLLMVFLPNWSVTRKLMATPLPIVPLAIGYGALLFWSWQPDTFSLILPGSWQEGFKAGFNPQFFPSLSGIVTLFSRTLTAASLWVHLLAVDLFAARLIYLEGQSYKLPTWHSILLAMTVAPLGLLSHALTKTLRSLLAPDS